MDRNRHVRLKSSVLTPLNQSLASELEAQQHLLSHYRRVGETKARVDSKSPQSFLHNSVAWKNQQNKLRGISSRQISKSSTPTTIGSFTRKNAECQKNHHLHSSTLKKSALSRNAIDHHESLSVAHKITWYLEALQSNAFCTAQHGGTEKKASRKPIPIQTNKSKAKKLCKNEVKIWQGQNATFTKGMAHNFKNTGTKTLHKPGDEILEVPHYRTWLREQAVRAKIRKETSFSQGTNSGSDSGRETERSSPAVNLKKQDDSYRLEFLSQVTEDILNMGLFSNRAIKNAIEFHVEQHKNIIDEAELEDLSRYLMESLNVTSEEKFTTADYNSYHSYRR